MGAGFRDLSSSLLFFLFHDPGQCATDSGVGSRLDTLGPLSRVSNYRIFAPLAKLAMA